MHAFVSGFSFHETPMTFDLHPFAQTFLYRLSTMTKLLSILFSVPPSLQNAEGFLASPKRLTLKFILCSFQGTLFFRQLKNHEVWLCQTSDEQKNVHH
jgi:hypothetical protein